MLLKRRAYYNRILALSNNGVLNTLEPLFERVYTLAGGGKHTLPLDCSDFSIQLGVILSACRYYIYPYNKLHATTDCKFRTYCSEQSMFVRQWQAEHCLTEGSLRSLSRTVQLISERKSSSERFFEVLFCRYKKVPKSLDCLGGKCRGKYILAVIVTTSLLVILVHSTGNQLFEKLQINSDWLDLQPSVEDDGGFGRYTSNSNIFTHRNDRDWRCVA